MTGPLPRHRGGRPLDGGRPSRTARPRLRRLVASLVTPSAVALGVVAGLFVGQAAEAALGAPTTGVTAAWSGTTVKSAQVSQAKGSAIFKNATNGALANADTRFSIGTLGPESIGYTQLVNDSSMPGILSVSASAITVLGKVQINVCTLPWVNGECPKGGINTLVGSAAVLAGGAVPYTTTTQIDVGKAVYFKVVVSGATSAQLDAKTPVFRKGMDRT